MRNILQGVFLLDLRKGASVNNSGGSSRDVYDNMVHVKSFWLGGRKYPYISAQSYKRIWRNVLYERANWNPSPITREEKSVYTEGDPVIHEDDDMFGYMRALGKASNKENATTKRKSPLNLSHITGMFERSITESFNVFSRFEYVNDDSKFDFNPVMYWSEFYNNIFHAIFSLDMDAVGRFTVGLQMGEQNYIEDFEFTDEHNDKIETNQDGIVTLKSDIRYQRVCDVIQALPYVYGGANQTNRYVKMSPSLIVLCVTDTGSHLFNYIFDVTKDDENGQEIILNEEAFRQVMRDYGDDIKSKIYIGIEDGFLPEVKRQVESLAEEFDIVVGSVKSVIDELCEELKSLM